MPIRADKEAYIKQLKKKLSDSTLHEFSIAKFSAILSSESIMLSAEIIENVAKEIGEAIGGMNDKIEKLNKTLEVMISSSNKMFWAAIATLVVMGLLTAAIAGSALVQAGIIKF